MTTVSAYEAKTHLPRLLRAAERGETVIITRHGKPVARLGPVEDRRREDLVIGRMKRDRAQRPKVTIEEILAWRHEGHKYQMSIVVDSSVVGCWCFPDEVNRVADAALSTVTADEVVVPAVWWFEVCNLLLTGERHGRMEPPGTARFPADLESLTVTVDRARAVSAVLALARAHRLRVYDASYLELALWIDAPLATLDKKLAAAARAEGVTLVGA